MKLSELCDDIADKIFSDSDKNKACDSLDSLGGLYKVLSENILSFTLMSTQMCWKKSDCRRDCCLKVKMFEIYISNSLPHGNHDLFSEVRDSQSIQSNCLALFHPTLRDDNKI